MTHPVYISYSQKDTYIANIYVYMFICPNLECVRGDSTISAITILILCLMNDKDRMIVSSNAYL